MLNEVELEEAKKKPKLNKPMKTLAVVKVRGFRSQPQAGNIKKVTFGDKKGGLEGNGMIQKLEHLCEKA